MQSREDVTRYLDWGPMSRDQARDLLARIKKLTAIGDKDDGLRLAMVLGASGVVIGDVSLWRTSREHAQGEIGFVLHPDHHGRGFGTEAMGELLRIGFEEVGIHRIVSRCDGRNGGGARLSRPLGVRLGAHLRENQLSKGARCGEATVAMA